MTNRQLNNPIKKLLMIILIAFTNTISAQVYVNNLATGMNNGTSWTDAYTNLKTAINNTSSGEIWVAMGTYKPTTIANQSLYFSMKNSVEIYGGFIGNETLRNQRNYLNNITILSGDIGISNDSTDNSYHVIYNSNINNTAILDGFTIQKGNANGNNGGGMYNTSSNPIISNCTFSNNTDLFGYGGAVYNYGQNPLFTNCKFSSNKAWNGGAVSNNSNSFPQFFFCNFENNIGLTDGGALFQDGNAPTTKNCIFTNNFAQEGGAIFVVGGVGFVSGVSSNIDSCIFTLNQASVRGGAIHNQSGVTSISNSKFNNNWSNGRGGAVNNLAGFANIYNSIFENNISNSDGGAVSTSNGSIAFEIINCVFANNKTLAGYGGAVLNEYGNGTYTNCLFSRDSSSFSGSAITNITCSPSFINCTIANNYTSFTNGGAIFNHTNSNPTFKNSIVYGNISSNSINFDNYSNSNPTVEFSIIEGGYSGASIINSNPLFYNSANPIGADGIWRTLDDGLQITFLSPAINNSNPTTTLPITDITGSARIGIFDIGAYESNNSFPLALNDIVLTGQNYPNLNKLKWNSNEKFMEYEIQKLIENNFETIGHIETSNLDTYNYDDNLINQNSNTYRILAKDITGNSLYSNSITLINNKDFSYIRIAPNPTNRFLAFLIDSKSKKNINVNIYSATGSITIQKTILVTNGMNEITIDVESLTDGYYSIEILTNSNNRNVETFIKKSN